MGNSKPQQLTRVLPNSRVENRSAQLQAVYLVLYAVGHNAPGRTIQGLIQMLEWACKAGRYFIANFHAETTMQYLC